VAVCTVVVAAAAAAAGEPRQEPEELHAVVAVVLEHRRSFVKNLSLWVD